jgi:hypothetical protein
MNWCGLSTWLLLADDTEKRSEEYVASAPHIGLD